MKRQLIIEVVCFLFVVLFLYAGFTKGVDVQRFEIQMSQSPLIVKYSRLLSYGVPLLEIVISGLLMIQRTRLTGLYAAFTLMVLFTIYIVFILNFASHVPCSCGGVLEQMGWAEHLIFNMVFSLLAFVGILLETKNRHQHSVTY